MEPPRLLTSPVPMGHWKTLSTQWKTAVKAMKDHGDDHEGGLRPDDDETPIKASHPTSPSMPDPGSPPGLPPVPTSSVLSLSPFFPREPPRLWRRLLEGAKEGAAEAAAASDQDGALGTSADAELPASVGVAISASSADDGAGHEPPADDGHEASVDHVHGLVAAADDGNVAPAGTVDMVTTEVDADEAVDESVDASAPDIDVANQLGETVLWSATQIDAAARITRCAHGWRRRRGIPVGSSVQASDAASSRKNRNATHQSAAVVPKGREPLSNGLKRAPSGFVGFSASHVPAADLHEARRGRGSTSQQPSPDSALKGDLHTTREVGAALILTLTLTPCTPLCQCV